MLSGKIKVIAAFSAHQELLLLLLVHYVPDKVQCRNTNNAFLHKK